MKRRNLIAKFLEMDCLRFDIEEMEHKENSGSTLRYKSVERLKPIGKNSLLGASGELSDFQEILLKKGHKYLGMVSMISVNFEDDHVATGFGNHLARPILHDEWREDLTFEEGVKLLEKCMHVLMYRD
ncbi:hypothetical protein EZV62_001944 [Acer yangbiense]|uniref:Proteasome subunit beta n=1 Tax=Acer yangbiense TaxID=1000413 RepID=A0A5C7IVX8_9ROSI|nr:hypothetical protein EZV62_001944 [Acer yangbiense]